MLHLPEDMVERDLSAYPSNLIQSILNLSIGKSTNFMLLQRNPQMNMLISPQLKK